MTTTNERPGRTQTVYGDLEERNRAIIRARQDEDPPPTYAELAERYGLSRARIGAIVQRARENGVEVP